MDGDEARKFGELEIATGPIEPVKPVERIEPLPEMADRLTKALETGMAEKPTVSMEQIAERIFKTPADFAGHPVVEVPAERVEAATMPDKITELIPRAHDNIFVLGKDGIEVVPKAPVPTRPYPDGEPTPPGWVITPTGETVRQGKLMEHYREKNRQMAANRGDVASYGEQRRQEYRGMSPARSALTGELEEFTRVREITFKDGPFDKIIRPFNAFELMSSESGLLYFFREFHGEIEQCIYRIILKERKKPELKPDASDEERAAHRAIPTEYDWIGEYVGKRRCPVPTVNGIRKVSPQTAG